MLGLNMTQESIFKKEAFNSPKPEGNLLSAMDINKVARSMYNRYQHTYGLTPCWGDNKKVDETCRDQVRSVLDALEMNGFTLIKAPTNIA